MRRRLALLCCALLAPAAGAAQPAGAAHRPAAAKVSCRWVKDRGRAARHRVCTKARPAAAHPAPARPVAVPAPVPAASPDPLDPAPAPAPPAPVPAAPPAAAPARLQATTREWSIVLSRPAIPAGAVLAELVNRGEDGHDLHVRPAAGGADVLAIPKTGSGEVADAPPVTLAAGTYTVYCALPGHEAAGMHATLTVG